MARTSRFSVAKKDIITLFNASQQKIYTPTQLATLLSENRSNWRLSSRMGSRSFSKEMISSTQLKEINVSFPDKDYKRFTWGKVSPYDVAQSIFSNSHLSHYTSVFLHNLTEQIPKSIYLRTELKFNPPKPKFFQQEFVDRAFQRKQRISKSEAVFGDFRLIHVYGKNTNDIGIIQINNDGSVIRTTDVERTLIDITIRPAYSGGISEVLKAFTAASEKASINRLVSYLKTLDYAYPYHQAIGYLVERSGVFSGAQIDLLDKLEKTCDFYLDYGIENKQYIQRWRLFVPEGF